MILDYPALKKRIGLVFIILNIIVSIAVGFRLFDLLRMMHSELGISNFGAFIIFVTYVSMTCFAFSILQAYFNDFKRYKKDNFVFCCIAAAFLSLLLIYFILNGALNLFFSQTVANQAICCLALFVYAFCCISTIIIHIKS